MIKDDLIIKGQIRVILKNIYTSEIKDTGWINNVITLVGRTAIARRIVNANLKINEGQITYCAVGTGITPPNVSDTILETEIDRVTISAGTTYVDNEVQIRAFFEAAEGNGSLKELGLFGEDATAATDSGTLFQRVVFDVDKNSSETMTILSKIPINYFT